MRSGLLSLLMLSATGMCSTAPVGEDSKPDQTITIKSQVTKEDGLDKVLERSHSKAHALRLTGGKYYRFELRGKGLTPILRLESPEGTALVLAEPSEEDGVTRLVYLPKATGSYRAIVTTAEAGETGGYVLEYAPAGTTDILFERVKKMEESSPAERKQVAAEFLKYLQGKKGNFARRDVGFAFAVGQAQEEESPRQAAATYRALAGALATSSDSKIAQIARMMEGAARRLDLPGHTMEMKAVTMAGKPLDWKSYRGKVVLVDFWATWCGPCRGELPNMKKMYDTYHDQGFEIIGVSLDYTKDALEKFLAEQKLPWINMFDADAGNQLSEYYGIFSIPLPILLDRNGRVVSMDARGRDLERLLKEQLGDSKR